MLKSRRPATSKPSPSLYRTVALIFPDGGHTQFGIWSNLERGASRGRLVLLDRRLTYCLLLWFRTVHNFPCELSYLVTLAGSVVPHVRLAPLFLSQSPCIVFGIIFWGSGMGAIKGRRRASQSKPESAENPRAVATITGLIRKLYASDSSTGATRKLPDDELIKWSDVTGAVRSS
jgi:hypothetical protein